MVKESKDGLIGLAERASLTEEDFKNGRKSHMGSGARTIGQMIDEALEGEVESCKEQLETWLNAHEPRTMGGPTKPPKVVYMTAEDFEKANKVKLIAKRDSFFMKLVSLFVPRFMTRYWTTYRLPFQRLPRIAYPNGVEDPMKNLGTLDHEMIHVGQLRPWYGPLWLSMLYTLFPFFVLFSGRWFVERRAYLLDIQNGRKTLESAVETLWKAYFYPWPKSLMRKWFTKEIRKAQAKEGEPW